MNNLITPLYFGKWKCQGRCCLCAAFNSSLATVRRRTVCVIDEEIRRSQKILKVEILGNVYIVPGFKKIY